MKQFLIIVFLVIADRVRRLMMRSERVFRVLFHPRLSRFRECVGHWKAWRAFEFAQRHCPGYRKFLAKHGQPQVEWHGWTPNLTAIPAMDKNNYIHAFSIAERCIGGCIPMQGAVIDESSGSSGTPNNWVRGTEERHYVARMVQLAMLSVLDNHPRLFINAFALGPWATGMCISGAVVDVCLLKSTGPDIKKIISTLQVFGRDFQYVIAGYPPFLKTLVDSPEIDWNDYHVAAFFGGEAISENMRTYLLNAFRGGVYGDYGASDLEVNIAAENDFTIAVRRLMVCNASLRHQLNGRFRDAIPSVFQYNPLDYLIESNADGELLITISRVTNASPRIRYNIHDLGKVVQFDELMRQLTAAGIPAASLPKPLAELPVLLMYGRSDSSVAYYGCKITPSEVEAILYENMNIAKCITAFALVTSEAPDTSKRLAICLELATGFVLPTAADTIALRNEVFRRLTEINQDFRESIRMVPAGHEPTIEFHEKGTGPFSTNDIRIKCRYIQHSCS